MKLKLTQKREYSILEASESISEQDAEILHAGLQKTFKASKNPLILDLSQAKVNPLALLTLSGFQLTAFKVGADLVIVSRDASLRQFQTQAEATQYLVSGRSLMPIRDGIYKEILKKQTEINAQLNAKSAELQERYIVQEKLPAENERLEAVLLAMEKRVEELKATIGGRPAPVPNSKLTDLENKTIELLKSKSYGSARA